MRLLIVCFLALIGWVASAPGSLSSSSSSSISSISSSNDNPEDLRPESEDDTLAPALNDLARRKRGSSKSNLPYSNYRPTSGMHRYRYPLYRKRSYRPQPSYDYEEEMMLPEVGSDYLEYDDQVRGPSLFRERSLQQKQQDRRKKEMLFEDDGYFSDDYVPENNNPLSSPFVMPLMKKDPLYTLANSPYDLHTIGHMYEMGKRDDASGPPLPPPGLSPYDIETLNQIHSVGRKSPNRLSPTEEFYDAIDSIKKKKAVYDDRFMNPSEATEKMEHLLKLKNFLSAAAGSRYLGDHNNGQAFSVRDPMIRKKRDTATANPNVVTKTNSTMTTRKTLASTVPARYQQSQISGDRRKRAFNDYFNWERKALASEYQPMEKRSTSNNNNKDFNDFLTREYFKSIARSVGQKKKRMAYAQFEADKRSSGLDDFLENPSMLEYMQSKLKEAEEEVAGEAEKELGESDTDTKELLSNIVVRLDALERMREALGRLEELQNEEAQEENARRAMSNGLSAASKKRQSSISSTGMAASKKRSDGSRKKQKKSAVDGRRIRRMRRGEESSLQAAFMGNSREECPVLERILLNCVSVSEIVGDQDLAFLEPCIRHEVCYMCGSGLSVSGHECDAILSSSLEAACSGNLDCLSAAGDTFNLLSNAERYDDNGTCTHDPCVRQFLESR